MINPESHKARYLRDRVPVRLGNLASSLAHLRSSAQHLTTNSSATIFLHECLAFLEWTWADTDERQQKELELLRLQLERWHSNWETILANQEQREAVAIEAEKWSDAILNLSGILDDEIWANYHR